VAWICSHTKAPLSEHGLFAIELSQEAQDPFLVRAGTDEAVQRLVKK